MPGIDEIIADAQRALADSLHAAYEAGRRHQSTEMREKFVAFFEGVIAPLAPPAPTAAPVAAEAPAAVPEPANDPAPEPPPVEAAAEEAPTESAPETEAPAEAAAETPPEGSTETASAA